MGFRVRVDRRSWNGTQLSSGSLEVVASPYNSFAGLLAEAAGTAARANWSAGLVGEGTGTAEPLAAAARANWSAGLLGEGAGTAEPLAAGASLVSALTSRNRS